MTNALGIPIVPCCPESRGGDVLPLLLGMGAMLVGHVIFNEFKRRKENPK